MNQMNNTKKDYDKFWDGTKELYKDIKVFLKKCWTKVKNGRIYRR